MPNPKRAARRAARRVKRTALNIALRNRDHETAKKGPGARLGLALKRAYMPKWIRRVVERVRQKRRLEERTGHMQRFSSSGFGNPIPLVLGRAMVEPTVFYASDFTTGAGDNIVPSLVAPAQPEGEDVELYITFALGVCAGPVGAITKVWADDTLIYNANAVDGLYTSNYVDFSTKLAFYLGTETQEADPFLEELEGAGNVPGYRGLCYIVGHGFPLKRFGNRMPNFRVEVVDSVTLTYPTETLTLSALDVDGLLLSRSRPLLYAWNSTIGILSGINRQDFTLNFQRDMTDLFNSVDDSGATLTSTFVIDEGGLGDDLYFFALSSGGGSFFLRFRPLLGTFDSNFEDALVGAAEVEGIGVGEFFFTADAVGAKVRGYRKVKSTTNPFVRLWEREGPNATAIPGNFTYDDQGRVWLISYLAADPDSGAGSKFFLSRITVDGQVTHFTVSNLGKCKQVAMSNLPFSGDRYFVCGGGAGGQLVRVLDNGNFSATLSSAGADAQRSLFLSQARFGGESFFATDGTDLFRINTRTMTKVQTIAEVDHGLRLTGLAYDRERDTIYSAEDAPAGDLVACRLDRALPDSISLGTAISDLCLLGGLTVGEVDVTSLTASIDGYAVSDAATAAEAIEALADVFLFGCAQSGSKLVFVPLKTGSATSIPADQLGSTTDGGEIDPYTYEIAGADQIPARITVTYPSAERDYSEVQQHEQRMADLWPGTAEVEIHTDVVLTDTSARQLAQKLVYSAERERLAYDLALPPGFLRHDASDFFSFTLNDGSTETVRADGVEIGADLFVQVSAPRVDADSYGAVAPGIGPDPSTGDLQTDAPTLLAVLDIPVVRPMDDRSGLTIAVAPLGPGAWQGARVSLSTDGVSFQPGIVLTHAATIGFATNPLGSSTATLFEPSASLSLQVLAGEFESATEAEIMEDATRNLLAVGSVDGGWELVQFASASDLGVGQWTLTGLLRGRFGTEHKTGTHTTGESVVQLSPEAIGRLSVGVELIGQEIRVRAVTVTSPNLVAQEVVLTYGAECLKPFSPTGLSGVRGSVVRDYDLFWFRRPRVGGLGWPDGFDAPVGESVEAYEVDILSGGVVVRVISVSMPPEIKTVNLSIASGDQSVNRASGSFVTDGYRPGQWIELRGFSNAANNGFWQIVTVAALKLTLTGGATLVTEASASGRRLKAASPVAVYTEAQQTADFGGLASSVTWRVCQMSAVVGRGHLSSELTTS